jgi:DUF4097 and DUF4098 domain-containing protein YvlB
MLPETIEREFSVVTPVRLRVKNIRGSVDVRPGDNGVATITAVKHLDTGNPDWTEIDIRQEEDGSLIVETIFKGFWQLCGRREPCKVDYVVRVPRACFLKVGCVSSKTLVQGLEGEFYIKTVSGRVALSDLSGTIKVTSVSGKIIGERLDGPTDFESVSGKVHLIESNLPIATGSSVSGDLLLQTPLGEGPYGFKTVSGDVKLLLPPETGCTIGFSSMSGRLKTSLPTTRSQRWNHKRYAELQGGGPPVRFRSVSGDFSVMEMLTTNAAPA